MPAILPPLTPSEAATNLACLQERSKPTTRYLAVYKGRSFVVIRYSTPYLIRFILYIRWLLGSVSYEKSEVERLAALSKAKWDPELPLKFEQLENKLANALSRLAQAEQLVAMKTRDLHEIEQVDRIRNQANKDMRTVLELVGNTRDIYQKLNQALQEEVQQAKAYRADQETAYHRLERAKQEVDLDKQKYYVAIMALDRQKEQLQKELQKRNIEAHPGSQRVPSAKKSLSYNQDLRHTAGATPSK
jgi:hypothetical protein